MTSYIKSYYKNIYKEAQFEADLRRKNRLRFCFSSDIKKKRILSVGSGPGVDVEFLVDKNEVHAIDISEEVLEIAKSKGLIPHNIDLNSLSNFPFESESFDVVIATDILEHIFDPKKVLIEIHRVLKTDGFAVLSVPNHFYWQRRLSILLGKGGIVLPFHNSNEWEYFHIRFFTLRGWEDLLDKIRFKIINRLYDRFIYTPRGLPKRINMWLARRFPGLFSMHFICKVKK